MSEQLPILYSFRRCPYAMRALIAGLSVQLREVVLREKPAQMVEASAKGTVPVLVLPDGRVIDESIDVMRFALAMSDPEGWLSPDKDEMRALIADNDGPFKHHLDRYKYASRYEDTDPEEHRVEAEKYLSALDIRLMANKHLMGETRSLADIAIFPFVRQFVNAAKDDMQMSRFSGLDRWLKGHVASPLFASVMGKYPQWQSGEPGTSFPE